MSELGSKIAPWEPLIESFRSKWGDRWLIKIVSIVTASIASKDENYNEFNDFCRRFKATCEAFSENA